jgi:ABC-2 type transport system permease protein
MKHFHAISTIAYRDVTKLLRDRPRFFVSLIFPFIFIGVLGGGLASSFDLAFDYIPFIFTGIFAQTMFSSSMSGVVSLIQDRENDFSKEIFVAPVSRYVIIAGKIIGESLVSFVQIIGVVLFSTLLFGVGFTAVQLLFLLPAAFMCAFLGGAFGILVLGNVSSQRTMNQIFPLVVFPQFFLSGAFSPVHNWAFPLSWLSAITPLRYAVDFVRGVYYKGLPEYDLVVVTAPAVNLLIITILLIIFLIVGTLLFVHKEENQ